MIAEIYNQFQTIRYFIRTKKFIDIESLGKLNKCVAVPIANSIEEIMPGVWLKKESRSFSKSNFTNVFDLFWDQNMGTVIPQIYSSNDPYFLSQRIKYQPKRIASINGGFFFLTDVANKYPVDLPYNLCIRNGKLFGLPSYDLPVAYIKNGALNAREVVARGTVDINGNEIAWVGANSKQKKEGVAVLYNSKCSDVVKIRDKNNIQIGILDEINIYTPKDKSVTDLVVNRNPKGDLTVSKINNGGGTHYFEGLFILQLKDKGNQFKLGDEVKPIDLDGILFFEIESGITIGRNVHDSFFYEKVRVDRHDARSVLAKDVTGKIHFIVFDGSKYIPSFAGVSAQEIGNYFSADRFQWAYFLDGGGSSRIIYRKDKKIIHLANEFAFRKLENGKKIWDWKNARKMASSISINLK